MFQTSLEGGSIQVVRLLLSYRTPRIKAFFVLAALIASASSSTKFLLRKTLLEDSNWTLEILRGLMLSKAFYSQLRALVLFFIN